MPDQILPSRKGIRGESSYDLAIEPKMTLPEKPEFDAFLRSLRTRPPERDTAFSSIVVAERVETAPQRSQPSAPPTDSGLSPGQERRLWWPEFQRGAASFFDRVAKDLRQRGHPEIESAPQVVLAAFASLIPAEQRTVAGLNGLLDQIADANTSVRCILNEQAGAMTPVSFGSFTLRRIDTDKVAYWVQRVGAESPFEVSALRGRVALERAPRPIRLLPLNAATSTDPLARFGGGLQCTIDIIHSYFRRVSLWLVDRFWAEFAADQDLLLPIGLPPIREEWFRNRTGTDWLIIISDLGPGGWGWAEALREDARAARAVGALAAEFRRTAGDLESLHAVSTLGQTELDRAIRAFAGIAAKGVRYRHSGLDADALLHFVIALELMLGDRSAISKSVSERAALPLACGRGSSLQEEVKLLKSAYDARSRYVHEGQTATPTHLKTAELACRAIYLSLLEYRKSPTADTQGAVDRWLAQLDYLVAATKAGKSIPAADWTLMGLPVLETSETSKAGVN